MVEKISLGQKPLAKKPLALTPSAPAAAQKPVAPKELARFTPLRVVNFLRAMQNRRAHDVYENKVGEIIDEMDDYRAYLTGAKQETVRLCHGCYITKTPRYDKLRSDNQGSYFTIGYYKKGEMTGSPDLSVTVDEGNELIA
jgi:hypothetical protein